MNNVPRSIAPPTAWCSSLAGLRFACGVVALIFLMPGVARAEAVWQEQTDDGYRETIRMTVTPADEPTPAFRHRLTLRPHELVPGNSVAHYMRAFPEGGIERTWRSVRDEFGEEVDDWYSGEVPISELPRERFVAAAGKFQNLIEHFIGPGSRCRETDWGVSFVDIKGPGIYTFLLPEIQAMRELARAASLRTRLAIVEHRYDDAIELLRMNYRLGRDVGKQPILVCGLVGIAICGVTNANTIELIAAPNSPNLYWALSELPRPHISLRDALRLEMANGPRMFESLDDPEHQTRTKDEWNALWRRDIHEFAELVDGANRTVFESLQYLALDARGYAHAKGRLVAWGYDQQQVEAMAVGQVLSIYSARVYQVVADEMEKLVYMDYSAGRKWRSRAEEIEGQLNWQGKHPDREVIPMISLLLPAITAVQTASFRSERELDALRVIEALRMHAAQNDGQWPNSLEDIRCVPVPKNVATGQPFEYQVEGDTAILLLPMSDGFRIEQRYELTITE